MVQTFILVLKIQFLWNFHIPFFQKGKIGTFSGLGTSLEFWTLLEVLNIGPQILIQEDNKVATENPILYINAD